MSIKLAAIGTLEERVAHLEHALNFSELILGLPMACGEDRDLSAVYQPLDTDLTEMAALANVRGDLLVTDASAVWARLPVGSTGKFLASDGTDPSWRLLVSTDIKELIALVDLTDVTGTTGSGTLVALGTTPTFTTSLLVPLIYNGATSSNSLTLQANTASFVDSNTGRVALDDRVKFWDSIPDSPGNVTVTAFDASVTINTAATTTALLVHGISPTITISAVGTIYNFQVLQATGTTTFNAYPAVASWYLFNANPTLSMGAAIGVGKAAPQPVVLRDLVTVAGASTIAVGTIGSHTTVSSTPTVSTTGASGSLTLTDLTALASLPSLISGTGGGTPSVLTVTNRRVVWIRDPGYTATGTLQLDNNIGVDIDSMVVGTSGNRTVTNVWGIRSQLAAGTNRWHLYLSGTASSYHNGNLLVGTNTDFASGTTHLKVAGGVSVAGDNSGVASHVSLTGTSDTSANSTGAGSIKFKGTTSRDSTGFIKIYVGTTAYYVPFFSAITG